MNMDLLYHAFLINTKKIYDRKKLENDSGVDVTLFVADLVGSYDWPYPFDSIYHHYYKAERTDGVNWNTARTQAGKIFMALIPKIETELKLKIEGFLAQRKGHPVTCYRLTPQP